MDLARRFGDVVALDGVSFTVPEGQIAGFVGPNGAGKTTTMRIALGVLEPDAGEVLWQGAHSTLGCVAGSDTCRRNAVSIRRACLDHLSDLRRLDSRLVERLGDTNPLDVGRSIAAVGRRHDPEIGHQPHA